MTHAKDDAKDMRRLNLGLRIGQEEPESEWLNVEARGLHFRLRVKSAHGGQASLLIEAPPAAIFVREKAKEKHLKGVKS